MYMRLFIYFLIALLFPFFLQAHIGPGKSGDKPTTGNPNTKPDRVQYRMDCAEGISQVDLDINNVRARLLIGGDLWWDGENNGRYIVPKIDPASGQPEVSSIFAGAVWIGGYDDGGNLKLAAQTYGAESDRDFWPGPLDSNGEIDAETCHNWDQFFRVKGTNIDLHIQNYLSAKAAGVPYELDDVPEDILAWPAKGNANFVEIHGFELPPNRELAPFFEPGEKNNIYEPELGDYPVIKIRGCTEMPQYPDDMIYWIYNDAGNIHTESQGSAIGMEIQVQSFGYSRNDELNDMTFTSYKLINREAIESINETYFAMWVDPDLGCYTDDYVGCDTSRSLAYVYNADAIDGNTTCGDCDGVATYCQNIPLLGVDYFRGPLNEEGDEIGMSSFTYYNNRLLNPPPGTDDPTNAIEFYNYISGRWRDGTPFTYGGSGYDLTSNDVIKYAFTEAPNDFNGWSMCSESLSEGDRRTIQASGPFRLEPGASNELIIGIPWVPDVKDYPCPDIRPLLRADDIAQGLFDACFKLTRGPDAPDLDWIELDQELIAVISNEERWNNHEEKYSTLDFQAPVWLSEEERSYSFEGYKVFQLVGPNVSRSELDNADKARLVYQADRKNGVKEIFNWFAIENPSAGPGDPTEIWVPESKVDGADQGVRHTFKIVEDQFAEGDRRLINHKKYYYTVIAYGYNNYEDFFQDGELLVGQPRPYIESDRNIRNYTVIPRPTVDRIIESNYGDRVVITRLEGAGAGGNFLAISKETREAICEGTTNGEITYLAGAGPLDIQIYNPLEVVDGEYELTFYDEDMSNLKLDEQVNWRLSKVGTNEIIESESTIAQLNEQLIAQYGFSVSIEQSDEPGDQADENNGAIGMDISYDNPDQPWLAAVQDTDPSPPFPFNFVKTGIGEFNQNLDTLQALSTIGDRFFVPYKLCDFRHSINVIPYITPALVDQFSESIQNTNRTQNLNNVDVVFTADKSKWSRCAIVEMANSYYYDTDPGLGLSTEGDAEHFDLRQSPSVGKEDLDGDGLPDPDGDGIGMGWFPGYAVDVETGERLNLFFGENSIYDGVASGNASNGRLTGRDMAWNPGNQTILETGDTLISNYVIGGQHFLYITRTPYNECADIRQYLDGPSNRKRFALNEVTWAGLFYLLPGQELTSYQDGLIPNDAFIQCRVENKYTVKEGTGERNGYPTYLFKIEDSSPTPVETQVEIEGALDAINVVPNPYYGFSDYETSQFSNIVKITNLPAKCSITIYTLDGKHIRSYERNEQGVAQTNRSDPGILVAQYRPAIEWDLKNKRGIPVASGVYLIHINAPGLGERVIKWFGVARQYDPSGL